MMADKCSFGLISPVHPLDHYGNLTVDSSRLRRTLRGRARLHENLLVVLLGIYVFFIVYASLMPFDLSFGQDRVSNRLTRAWEYQPFGPQRVSRSDLLSNLALYVPMGLLAGMRLSVRRGSSKVAAFFVAGCLIVATTLGVESCQLLSDRRTASVTDSLLNLLGGMLGASLGICWGRKWWITLRRQVRYRWRYRPISFVAIAILILLAADATSPLLPTVEVSEVWQNAKNSHLSLWEGLGVHPWHHWVVERIGVYAALALILAAWSGKSDLRNLIGGGMSAMIFAVGTETAKLFIVSRSANIANLVTSLFGVCLGTTLSCLFAQRLSRRAKLLICVFCLTLYTTYLEWLPFGFAWDRSEAMMKFPKGAEWLPLYHYAMGARFEDIRLFCRTLALSAGIVLSVGLLRFLRTPDVERSRWRWAIEGAVVGTGLGLLLESVQFTLPDRIPSVTDIFCFGFGGCLGGLLVRARLRSEVPSVTTSPTWSN